MLVILALGRLRQEDQQEFKGILNSRPLGCEDTVSKQSNDDNKFQEEQGRKWRVSGRERGFKAEGRGGHKRSVWQLLGRKIAEDRCVKWEIPDSKKNWKRRGEEEGGENVFEGGKKRHHSNKLRVPKHILLFPETGRHPSLFLITTAEVPQRVGPTKGVQQEKINFYHRAEIRNHPQRGRGPKGTSPHIREPRGLWTSMARGASTALQMDYQDYR